ncbi:MAG: hypothetical protein AB203_00355 [Parcubacteria bacterium C7867-008]|nr:MAG: hypothetical protein AB203_00355 [Parcubacteria bacterium C7867-008]
MTRFGWLVLGLILLFIAGIGAGWYLVSRYDAAEKPTPMATSTPGTDLSSSSIYTNGTYGFSIVYPAADQLTEMFTPWRSGAMASGTPLVAIADPEGMIRIGANADAKAIDACTKPGQAEKVQATMALGSTTFSTFTHDEVGTDNERRVTSYRAVHEKACVAIEIFQPITDGLPTPSTALMEIVNSFSFARL